MTNEPNPPLRPTSPPPPGPPGPEPLLSLYATVVLIAAVVIGTVAGVLTLLSGATVAGAVLAGLGAAGAGVAVLPTLIRRT